MPDRDEVARILMRIFLNSRQAIAFLRNINGRLYRITSSMLSSAGLEIAKSTDGATLFRSNSMATKVCLHWHR